MCVSSNFPVCFNVYFPVLLSFSCRFCVVLSAICLSGLMVGLCECFVSNLFVCLLLLVFFSN